MENRNLQWSKRAKVPLILIFSVNTNHESVAYRSFTPSEFEARGARKVTTGIGSLDELPHPINRVVNESRRHFFSPRQCHQHCLVGPRQSANRERVVRLFFWGGTLCNS